MRSKLLSLQITTGLYYPFLASVLELVGKGSSYICVANVHMLVEAHNDPQFADKVNQAEYVTPDGVPLTWGLKLVHGITQPRIAGMDLLPDLLLESERRSISVYFYGGTEEMLSKTQEYVQHHYPGLKIAGMYSPPFRSLTAEEETGIADTINKSGAGFVFVALGCPKQEKWMASMKGRVNACMIGIGGALPVLIGMQNRAPGIVQKTGFEWLYRLMQEPKRLFKRYAITNSTFLWLLIKEVIKTRVFGKKNVV